MAYVTSQKERQKIKNDVFSVLSPNASPIKCGREMYRCGKNVIHARYCAPGVGKYKFNINPNTLRAAYELWICGTADLWYLIPISVIYHMYDHPDAYIDKHHPEIRVVGVDPDHHQAAYAKPSIKIDIEPYFCLALKEG
jgi:hypothetical protein